MLTITVNGHTSFETENRNNSCYINNQPVDIDLRQINTNTFHAIRDHQSYQIYVVSIDRVAKTCVIRVNSNIYHLDIKNQFDRLLQQLGIDNLNAVKITDLKAPMPGLVIKTLVAPGDQVKKGDSLIVLEAMKMENNIKAPCDLTIKQLKVAAGDIVEKNQIMIVFE